MSVKDGPTLAVEIPFSGKKFLLWKIQDRRQYPSMQYPSKPRSLIKSLLPIFHRINNYERARRRPPAPEHSRDRRGGIHRESRGDQVGEEVRTLQGM